MMWLNRAWAVYGASYPRNNYWVTGSFRGQRAGAYHPGVGPYSTCNGRGRVSTRFRYRRSLAQTGTSM